MRTILKAVLCCMVWWGAGGPRMVQAQQPRSPLVVPEQQAEKLLLYNLALGAGIGGVGAALTGTRGTAWERFWRGAGRGALGGALLYEGKRLAHLIVQEQQPAYGLLAVGVHELGGSIVENASYDRRPLDRLYLHTGFLRWEWRPGAGVQARVMPYALNSSLYLLRSGHRLDVPKSLAIATPVFRKAPSKSDLRESGLLRGGFAIPGAVYVADLSGYPEFGGRGREWGVLAHELVHVLQYREYMRANVVLEPAQRFGERFTMYRTMSEWIYVDAPYAFRGLYRSMDHEPECHYNNWFEREAEVLSENRSVPVCR